jgi:branched-chain amino acid transport system ATP-binding protein
MLLELKGVGMYFGGLRALDGVDLVLEQGMIRSLIGPNGAGKTTLFNIISGLYPATQGEIVFLGRKITGMKPFEISRLGIARTFQNIRLFQHMSVLQNVMVGEHNQTKTGLMGAVLRTPSMRKEEKEAEKEALSLLEFVGLPELMNERAQGLPYGKQRLLELARALASKPRLLLLDEPTAGMNLTETATLTRMILKIRKMGVTVFLVEHRMKVVMEISDQVTVLDHGSKISEGTPDQVKEDEKVIRAYLGEKRRERLSGNG